jgi:UDP-N-acetylglucosamine 2-epimerase (non-hydrolysing)
VITDSGGIQEETSFLGIPCLTVRPNTERPVTVTQGSNRLIDPAKESLAQASRAAMSRAGEFSNRTIEYWDGATAPRIVDALEDLL